MDIDSLYVAYKDKLLNYANSLLHDRHLCEEIVNDVFVIIWSKDIPGIINYDAYMCRMVKFRCINVHRGVRKKIDILYKDYIHPNIEDVSKPYDDSAALKALCMLSRLTPTQSKDIYMHYIRGMRSNEIGRDTYRAWTTVRNNISNGMKHLKQLS